MNAVISGSSGVAMLVEGDRFSSYHVDSPQTIVPRSPNEYALLFAGSRNLEFLENVLQAEVDARLRSAVARERALHVSLC